MHVNSTPLLKAHEEFASDAREEQPSGLGRAARASALSGLPRLLRLDDHEGMVNSMLIDFFPWY